MDTLTTTGLDPWRNRRSSTYGSIFILVIETVTWSSRKLEITTLSTIEIKYIAASWTSCQAFWLKRLFDVMEVVQKKAITIMCNNKFVVSITKNPTHNGRIKYISIRFHSMRVLTIDGMINLRHSSSVERVVNILTKALPIQKCIHLRNKHGV